MAETGVVVVVLFAGQKWALREREGLGDLLEIVYAGIFSPRVALRIVREMAMPSRKKEDLLKLLRWSPVALSVSYNLWTFMARELRC